MFLRLLQMVTIQTKIVQAWTEVSNHFCGDWEVQTYVKFTEYMMCTEKNVLFK